MKKLIYIASIICMFSSCNFLNNEVYDYLDKDGTILNEERCFATLTGVYEVLGRGEVYGHNIWGYLDAGSDLMLYNRGYNLEIVDVRLKNYNSNEKSIYDTWCGLYNGINRANDFLKNMEAVDASKWGKPAMKEQYMAEARALRALYYLNLVSFWGDVPLRLEPTHDLSAQHLRRSKQADVYKQIIVDLKYGLGEDITSEDPNWKATPRLLPANQLNTPGRMSQTAAEALLARAYLWMSGYPVAADEYANALKYAQRVQNSSLHHLYPRSAGGYRQYFITMCSNQYEPFPRESIFEVEFYGNGMEATNEGGQLGYSIGISQGSMKSKTVGYSFAAYDISKILFRMYNNFDERKWWNTNDYTWKTTSSTAHEDIVEKVLFTDEDKAKREEGNASKWRREYDPVVPFTKTVTSINFPVMRYAEVLLIMAESANELRDRDGNAATVATNALNEIRTRVGLGRYSAGDYSKEELRTMIQDERAREMCFEGNRHMDLRRWSDSRLGTPNFFFDRIQLLTSSAFESGKLVGYPSDNVKARPSLNLERRHFYLPIPQRELDTNPICGQNSGW